MRPQKILDEDMITGLAKVFKENGYEGTSLNELAQVTGLKKASLYHRFPKGKQEMAEAVLNHIDNWVNENIFLTLKDADKLPKSRLKESLRHINTLYNGGKETCILRSLSMQAGLSLFETQVKNGMDNWINAFVELGLALEQTATVARKNALQTLVEIQGSLIVTKGLNNSDIFENTLKGIEIRYSEY